MKATKIFFTLVAFGLASCSSIKSIEEPYKGNTDGLTYFMPKKDFLVTVTVKGGKVEKVALGNTPAYPDLSKQYLLRHGGNVVGKNTLNVVITEQGLLSSSKSTTQSNVSDAFKNLAASLGSVKPLSLGTKVGSDKTCSTDGENTFVFKTVGEYTACAINIKIEKQITHTETKSTAKVENVEYSGVFYRQNIPYLVTASGGGLNETSIVFSPSESPTRFLPVSQTFFSNNAADFGFTDGVPTKFNQETEGEAVALLKLPADIIGAYFAAIGSVFDSFKSNDTKEADALAASLKLDLEKAHYDTCIAAIKANEDAKIKELACQ